MRKLVLFGMVGVLAPADRRRLGMAYGLTSTTMLVAVGTGPGGGLGHRAPGRAGHHRGVGRPTGASATSTGARCAG